MPAKNKTDLLTITQNEFQKLERVIGGIDPAFALLHDD